MRSSPLLASAAALATGALACAPATSPPPAARPASVEVSARPPRCSTPAGLQPGRSFALSYTFDRFTSGGALRLVERGDEKAGHRVRKVAIADPATGAIRTTRDALPHAVWLSTDASIQLVWEPGALVRVDLGRAPAVQRTRVAAASKDSDADYVEGIDPWSLSDDGRLVVHETEVREVDGGARVHVLPPVSAGGPNQHAGFVDGTRDLWACMRGCALFDPRGKPRDLSTDDAVRYGDRFDLAADAGAVLVMPHQPFAMEWDDAFRVCTLDGKPCRPKLALTIPKAAGPGPRRDFDAALCPTGELAVVAWQGALHLFDTRKGAEVATFEAREAFARGEAPTVRYAPGSDAIAIVKDGTLQWMEPTF